MSLSPTISFSVLAFFLDVFMSFEPCFEESKGLSRFSSAFIGTREQIICSFGLWGWMTEPQTSVQGMCSATEQYPR